MAVCRVERTGDFTTMSNHHLKNQGLSLKAKGLLSLMLSLPDNWDYTVRGLVKICKDGENCIRATIQELERAGYIQRERVRDTTGRFVATEYIIREHPIDACRPTSQCKIPVPENPDAEKPNVEKPNVEKPGVENPAQLITKEVNTDKSITDLAITHSFFQAEPGEGTNVTDDVRDKIKKQIEYDCLIDRYNRHQLDELVEIMLEVALNRGQTVRIGRDNEYPREYVQERFSKINAMHIERVMDGISDNQVPVRNTKAYLMSVLFNSVSTIDHFYTIQANSEYQGSF